VPNPIASFAQWLVHISLLVGSLAAIFLQRLKVDVDECKRLFLVMDPEFLDESTLVTFQKFCGDAKEDVCFSLIAACLPLDGLPVHACE
jgi:hypothetical protein